MRCRVKVALVKGLLNSGIQFMSLHTKLSWLILFIAYTQSNYENHFTTLASVLSHKINAVCAFQITYNLFPFFSGRFLKKLAEDQCSSMTEGSIYHIKHIFIQLFTMRVDWPDEHLTEVSDMLLNICTYCIFTL